MAIVPDELFRLPRIAAVIREHAKTETPADQAALDRLNYKAGYSVVVDGKVPAVRVGAGWGVYGRDLPAFAAHLNIRLGDVGPSAAKPVRAERAPSPSNAVAA